MSPRRRLTFAVCTILTLAGFTTWLFFFKTYHLATVQPNALYRDGCQKPGEFVNAINRVNPRTVVSLIDDNERNDPTKPQFKMEEGVLKRHGIELVRIPVKLGGWPTKEDVEKFLAIAKDKDRQPVLVHCAQGVRRTGMMVAAYQEAVMGMTDDQAKQAIVTFGHSARTGDDVRRFIDGYDPKAGTVLEAPTTGEE